MAGKQGCRICAFENSSNIRTYDTDKFKELATTMHGDKYNYDLVNYIKHDRHVSIICNKCKKTFNQKPSVHLFGCGCSKCYKNISKPERLFLELLKIEDSPESRQLRIKGLIVDGYDKNTNTVYEFLGDYWHGNPNKYSPNNINKSCKKTFGELFNKTVIKLTKLKSLGYNVKYVWESDWNEYIKGESELKIKNYE